MNRLMNRSANHGENLIVPLTFINEFEFRLDFLCRMNLKSLEWHFYQAVDGSDYLLV